MAFEVFENRQELKLTSIADIKKFLVPFLRRNGLEEVEVHILDGEKIIGKFRFSYINGSSQIDGQKDCSPFKPGFLAYLRKLGFQDSMSFLAQPYEKRVIDVAPVIEVVQMVNDEVGGIVPDTRNNILEDRDSIGDDTGSKQGTKVKKIKKGPGNKRKKPTKAEKKAKNSTNSRRAHVDRMRGDRWGIEYAMRLFTGVGKPTPSGYLGLSSKLVTRVTQRSYDEYREELFGEKTHQEFEKWIQELPIGTNWLDIGSGNSYKNPNSLANYLQQNQAKVVLTCYDPIYIGKQDFPVNAEFIGGHAQELPFEDEVFDIITSLHVFDKISDENAGVQVSFLEALRVLKPGGTLKVAPIVTLDIIHALMMIMQDLGEDIECFDVYILGNQLNIHKHHSLSLDTMEKIRQKVKWWNEEGRFLSQPLKGVNSFFI